MPQSALGSAAPLPQAPYFSVSHSKSEDGEAVLVDPPAQEEVGARELSSTHAAATRLPEATHQSISEEHRSHNSVGSKDAEDLDGEEAREDSAAAAARAEAARLGRSLDEAKRLLDEMTRDTLRYGQRALTECIVDPDGDGDEDLRCEPAAGARDGVSTNGVCGSASAADAELGDDVVPLCSMAVAVVGLGGMGAAIAEAFARAGVARLHLFDAGRVELAQLQGIGYTPEQHGMRRVDAVRHAALVARVRLTSDATSDGDAAFMCSANAIDVAAEGGASFVTDALEHGGVPAPDAPHGEQAAVDLVVHVCDPSAAEEPATSVRVGQCALRARVPALFTQAPHDGTGGHVRLVLPGASACLQCRGMPPLPPPQLDPHARSRIEARVPLHRQGEESSSEDGRAGSKPNEECPVGAGDDADGVPTVVSMSARSGSWKPAAGAFGGGDVGPDGEDVPLSVTVDAAAVASQMVVTGTALQTAFKFLCEYGVVSPVTVYRSADAVLAPSFVAASASCTNRDCRDAQDEAAGELAIGEVVRR